MSKNRFHEFSNGLQFEYDESELETLTELELHLLQEVIEEIDSQIQEYDLSKQQLYNKMLSEGVDLFEASLREVVANRWVYLSEAVSTIRKRQHSHQLNPGDAHRFSKITMKHPHKFKY